jgi:GWxTD domain-containing protein
MTPGRILSGLLLLSFLSLEGVSLAAAAGPLPQKYRDWLDREVVYIITKEEHDLFLNLASDADRDKFIDKFWEIRNPSPGAPVNTYKVEHYDRLAYANQHFGREAGTEGWHTDMGRTYITIGPPQQRAPYLGYSMLRPMEIWFYSSPSEALPPFFSVIFYQREYGTDFRYYSPYNDGPQKLVNPSAGTENNDRGALNIIDRAAGREVARTVLSLIPDEPVDFQNARASLQSDIMLGRIRNLANDPVTKTALDRRRQMLDRVTTKVIFDEDYATLLAVPLRDSTGRTNVHYLLRLNRPEDFAVVEAADGRYYYAAQVSAHVMTADNKPIYGIERKLTRYIDKKALDQVKGKTFAFEGVLPLAPGKYHLEFLLTNGVKQTAFRARRDVDVPDVVANTLQVSSLVAFSDARVLGGDSAFLPFSAAGVRFVPMAGAELHMEPHGVMKFFYQVWEPGLLAEQRRGKKLQVEYIFGRIGVRGDHQAITDEVPAEQFDPGGSLINGKRLPLPDGAGNYTLNVTVTDPETRQKAYGSLKFQLTDHPNNIEPWEVFDEDGQEEALNGTVEYQRALCYLALGNTDRAVPLLREALRRKPEYEAARDHLVDVFYGRKEFSEVAGLSTGVVFTGETTEETFLRMAEGLDKSSATPKAVDLLESALKVHPSSGPICLALASYYQRLGESGKAADFERRGKSLLASRPSS